MDSLLLDIGCFIIWMELGAASIMWGISRIISAINSKKKDD